LGREGDEAEVLQAVRRERSTVFRQNEARLSELIGVGNKIY